MAGDVQGGRDNNEEAVMIGWCISILKILIKDFWVVVQTKRHSPFQLLRFFGRCDVPICKRRGAANNS